MSEATMTFTPPLAPEDRMRADLYGLFARLLLAAPDADLLRAIGAATGEASGEASGNGGEAPPFATAWSKLAAASRAMDPGAAADEFDALFGGVGHSAISLFGSHYMQQEAAAEPLLVSLRAALAELGLGRQMGINLPEDHLAAVFESMRLLISGGPDVQPKDLAMQRFFFMRFVGAWVPRCGNAILMNAVANYYKAVAECLLHFISIEDESLAIE